MKAEKMYILYLLSVLLVLTIIGACIAGASRPLSPEEQERVEKIYEATDYALHPVKVEHGKDEEIVWEDPGLEAHIRFLMNKPEGKIKRSDVWDVQVLSIQTAFQSKFDVMMSELPENESCFTRSNSINNPNAFHNIGNRGFPAIRSLKDLEHFESLQILSILEEEREKNSLNLRGIEDCKNLVFVQIGNKEIEAPEKLGEIRNLEMLFLQNCGEIKTEPIWKCSNLRALSLITCKIETMCGIDELEKLKYLNLTESDVKEEETIPSGAKVEIVIR